MTPSTGTGKSGIVYKYYVCLSKTKAPKQNLCKNAQVPANEFENAVSWSLRQLITDKTLLANKIAHYNHQLSKANAELKDKEDELKKQDAEMRNEYEGLFKVLSAKKLHNYQKIDERLKVLQQAEAEVSRTLEDIKVKMEQNDRAMFDGKGLKWCLRHYKEHENTMKFEFKRSLMRAMINRVLYKGNEIELKLNDVKGAEETDTGALSSTRFHGFEDALEMGG